MKYTRLGRTGLLVSRLCLGSNTFGGGKLDFWKALGGLEQADVNGIIGRALDGGVNFIDTANTYSNGESESRIGQSLKDLGIARDRVVIATKVGGRVGAGPNQAGSSRSYLLRETERSLRRLGVDHVDVLMVHYFDPATPLEETLHALDRLVSDGKVRYLGCSNFAAWEAMKALGISHSGSLARFEVVEAQWSVASRGIERELLPLVRDQQLGLMVWGALLGGLLTGKYLRDGTGTGRMAGALPPVIDHDKLFDVVDALRAIAPHHQATPGQIALAWLLHQPAVTCALFGARDAAQVDDNLGAVDIALDAAELQTLDAVHAPVADYGPWLVRQARADRASCA